MATGSIADRASFGQMVCKKLAETKAAHEDLKGLNVRLSQVFSNTRFDIRNFLQAAHDENERSRT
jgi:hypothetical protein